MSRVEEVVAKTGEDFLTVNENHKFILLCALVIDLREADSC